MRTIASSLFTLLGLSGMLLAQQPPATSTTTTSSASTVVTTDGQPIKVEVKVNGQDVSKPDSVRERERTIYVPYDQLEKTFKDGGKGVFLPYKEFLELWNELTLKRKADEVKPPEDGVVSKAEYTGHVEGDTLIIDAKITVESFKKGWLTLSLAKDQVPGIAEADTGKAVLSAKPDGYDVILPEKGIYELKLKIYAAIRRVGGKQTVSLVLPRAAVSRFVTTVPGTGLEFEVNPAAAFTSRPAGADTELSFFFGSGSKFDVSWSKPETATQLAPLVLATTAMTSEVRGGSLATSAKIDLRILRAPVPSFVFQLPASQTVQGVTGSDVKDWKLETAGDKQKLTITPNAPVKDAWGVTITLETALPKLPGEVVVPEITLDGATQDRGEVSVAAEGQLDVTPKPAEGLVQQTQTAAPAQGLSAVGGYRYLKHPAKLSLSIAEAKPQVDVDSLTLLTVKRDTSRVEVNFGFNIRRVGVFEARVALPAGWTGWEVVGLAPDQWSIEKAGAAETLAVKFPKQTIGQASFTIRGQQQRANPTEDATVPVFAPQGVVRYDAKIGVGVHSSLEVTTKAMGDLRLDDVSSLNIQQPQQQGTDTTELTLAFRHRDAAKTPATLTFKARDPQVNVEVLTMVEAKEQSLRHTWTLAFDIAYAATDRFVLAVPKSVADDIRFVDPNVKEIHKDYKADAKLTDTLPSAADYVLWEVVLRNERMGAFTLALSVEKPLAAGKEAKLDLLQVHVPGVFQEIGQVAVVKDDSLEIRDYKAESLEEIDPKELHSQLQRGGVFLAFKYKTQPLKLGLSVVKNAYIAVPQAHVGHAVLTTAVSTDRAQTTEVVYWVQNNAQQFLTVKLPKGSRLVSDVFVNGASQQPMHREGSDDLLVRLPANGSRRIANFPVRFVYEIPSPSAGDKLGWWGGFSVAAPTLDSVGVFESHHQLYLPEGYLYTKFDGPMTLSVRDRGWAKVRNAFDALLPAFGPQLQAPGEDWHPVVGIPNNQRASFEFQVPKQGQPAKLHRLGAPATIDVSFRSKKLSYVLESIAFLLVAFLGLRAWNKPLPWKMAWVCGWGLVAMISTGVVSAANGRISKSVLLGVFFIAAIWSALFVISVARAILKKLSTPKPQPPVTSTPPKRPEPKFVPPAKAEAPKTVTPPTAPPSTTPSDAKPSDASDLEFPSLPSEEKKADGGPETK